MTRAAPKPARPVSAARRFSPVLVAGLGLGIAALLAPAPVEAQRSLKVHISADMEGLAGSVSDQQLGPGGFEYQRFREFMTEEVLAAVEAARAAGATEILIADSHGNGQNLLIERFDDDIRIIRSWPRPLGMMAGIDSTFDAAIFIGYHSSTDNPEGVRAHTMSSATLTSVKLNGRVVSEGVINAAIAGHYGVPVVMIAGDDAAVEELRASVGDVEGAVVKEAISFHSAKTMTPAAGRRLIAEKVRAALGRLDDFEPYRLSAPIALDVTFKNYRQGELLAYLPIVERTGSHSIRFVADDMPTISRFVQFMNGYESGLSP